MKTLNTSENISTLQDKAKFAGLTIKKASEMAAWGFCMVIYGAPGVGKTTLAATCADSLYGAPVLFCDADGGMRSISHRNDIDVIEVINWKQITSLTNEVQKECPWKTIVHDNLSEYRIVNMRSITAEIPTWPEYNRNTTEMLVFIRKWRDIARLHGINVIFIAWDKSEKDESTGFIKKELAFTPSLAETLPGVVDIIGHMTIENDPPIFTRLLNFSPGPRTSAKFRRSKSEHASKIPLVIPNPTMVDLLATLKGGEPWPESKYAKYEIKATGKVTPTSTK